MVRDSAIEFTGIASTPRTRGYVVRRILRLARRQPLGLLGLAMIVFVVLAAILAPWVAPYRPNSTEFDLLKAPSWAHPFGTDRLGRDVLTRVLHGARISMAVGFGSVAIGTVAGMVIGLASGYYGGWFDAICQRLVDTMLAFPYLVLAMFIGAVAGRGTGVLIWVIGIAIAPGVVRVVRGSVLAEQARDYVLAARAMGASAPRVMLRHILPNVMAPITVIATTLLAAAILAEAALSFLGLGVAPPTASWGGDLSGSSRDFFEVAPWMAIFPGLALSFAVMGFNFFGDALRDVLDPKLKGTGP